MADEARPSRESNQTELQNPRLLSLASTIDDAELHDAFQNWRLTFARPMNEGDALRYVLRAWLTAMGHLPRQTPI